MVVIEGKMYREFDDFVAEHSLGIIPVKINEYSSKKGGPFLADRLDENGLIAVCTTSDVTLYTKDEYKIAYEGE